MPTTADTDPTYFLTRTTLARVLDAHGVVSVVNDGEIRTWTFVDGLMVEERVEPESDGTPVHALATALGNAIRSTDPTDEDAALCRDGR